MKSAAADIREVYNISQRLEEKIDKLDEKLENRITPLEKKLANLEGKASVIAVVWSSVVAIAAILFNYFSRR